MRRITVTLPVDISKDSDASEHSLEVGKHSDEENDNKPLMEHIGRQN